jgi:hypothetical protein
MDEVLYLFQKKINARGKRGMRQQHPNPFVSEWLVRIVTSQSLMQMWRQLLPTLVANMLVEPDAEDGKCFLVVAIAVSEKTSDSPQCSSTIITIIFS